MQKNYKIESIINNNFVATRKDGIEIILAGRGIAFGRKIGDYVDQSKIEKTFSLEDARQKQNFTNLAETLPEDLMELTVKVVNVIENSSQLHLKTVTFMALADHIAFALERYQNGQHMPNKLLNEAKRFYPFEIELGKKAIDVIYKETGISLSEDEAGFIAIHLINTSESSDTSGVQQLKMIKDIISIVQDYFEITFDEESFYYQRFVTHLKFFVFRVLKEKENESTSVRDDFFYRVSKVQYPQIHKCVNLIEEYLDFNYSITIANEEKGYLVIHLSGLLKRKMK